MHSLKLGEGNRIGLTILLLAGFATMMFSSNTAEFALAQPAGQPLSVPGTPDQHPFGPPPVDELSAAQANASTNKTCTLTPSLIEVEGTPNRLKVHTL